MSGPFRTPMFPPKQDSEVSSAPAATAHKYNFNFRQSALSSVADNMWSQSRQQFKSSHNEGEKVVLEKKSLNDVLGKMVGEKEHSKDDAEKPKFVFGSQVKDKVVVSDAGNGSVPSVSETPEKEETAHSKTSLIEGDSETSAKDRFREQSEAVAADLKKEQEKAKASTSVVEVKTGEESDRNLFQTACKLHSYDKEQKKWVERGLSHIRINERQENGQTHYRIVVRSVGNQRVLVNSKMFADMLLERIDSRRTKLSATAPESITPQVFLITISFGKTDLSSDALFNTLSDCLEKEKRMSGIDRKRRAASDLDQYESVEETKKARSESGDEQEKKDEESVEESAEKEANDDDAEESRRYEYAVDDKEESAAAEAETADRPESQ